MRAKLTLTKLILTCICFVLPVFSMAAEQAELNLKQILLMPGELTQSHAKFEPQCQQCHLHFEKSNQAPLCLDCHKGIQEDVTNKTGFHGQLKRKQLNECSSCHSDHLGRDVDIMAFDVDQFDHNKTQFPLEGSHLTQTCKNCHNEKHPKSGKPTFRLPDFKPQAQCASCHEDPHEGNLADDCTSCHAQDKWQVEKFDHSKTDFLLKDKHQEVSCQSCHVKDVAAPVGKQCSNCHKSNDKHLGVFGEKCADCHNEKGWDKTNYNHFEATEFDLLGKHNKLQCAACHFNKKEPEKTCNSCHASNDIHLGSNGNDCKQCHNNDKWSKTEFDHNKSTDFLLQGAHIDLTCSACHQPGQVHKEPALGQTKNVRQCKDCHQTNDPHKGALGKTCQDCHQQTKWIEKVTFNHDFTDFPLTGGHQMLVCQSCHDSADFAVKEQDCVDCHQKDDIHEQTLTNQCATCHNPSSWTTWQFDHQKQTDYPLKGAHSNLSCELCHSPSLPKPLSPPNSCATCHKEDDVHNGTFGKNCQQCHTTERFYD